MPIQGPFSLLTQLAGDSEQAGIFSEDSTLNGWLATERALAAAQGVVGAISREDALAIIAAAVAENIDRETLWDASRNVGYPILALVRQIASALPNGPDGRVHYGATTQDIMDTGLALQLDRSITSLHQSLVALGDSVAVRVDEHAGTVMAARTHAQQAVPTTFGATLATLLSQLTRQRARLLEARPRVARVSLFGAGGTAAALGPRSAQVRDHMAVLLGLEPSQVPWHADRDGVAEFGWLCVTLAATCARLARNVIDLSRTEIGEVFEPGGAHRGASSTMPQKANPIAAEMIVGASGVAGALASALARVQEAGHERAAGEWQIEWHVLPQLAELAGVALSKAREIIAGMRVEVDRMRSNLELDGGLVMTEALMFQLATVAGRGVAHDLVYEAAARSRATHQSVVTELAEIAAARGLGHLVPGTPLTVDDYLGEAGGMCRVAVAQWEAGKRSDVGDHAVLLTDLARTLPEAQR